MLLKNVVRILSCTTAALVIAAIIFHQDITSALISRSDRRVAVYSQYSFHGFPEFVKVRIDSPIADAQLYVELPNGERYLLRDIPENAVKPYLKHHDYRQSIVRP